MKLRAKKQKLQLFSILFGVVVTYPFISVANKPAGSTGIPALFLYIFIVWALGILCIFLLADRKPRNRDE